MCSFVWLVDGIIVILTPQDGKTALHLASHYDRVGVVQLLIGAHAKLNLQDKVLYMCLLTFSSSTLLHSHLDVLYIYIFFLGGGGIVPTLLLLQ